MSLYSYQVFETVVTAGSFSKAAEVLKLTPSAVSHQIGTLERELNIKLFNRSRQGVVLTEAGSRLLPHVSAIRAHNEQLVQEISEIHGLSKGTVRVGCFNSVTVHWLPTIISTFHETYPDIKIEVFQGGYDDILGWLEHNTIDLAFITDFLAPNPDFIPLHKDMFVCVTPNNCPLVHPEYVTIEDIKEMPLILQSNGCDVEIKQFLAKHNVSISSSFNIDTDESLIAMVAAGFGCCIMPYLASQNYYDNVRVLPIVPRVYRTIGLYTLNPHATAPATKKMRRHILSYVEDHNLMNI